MKRVIIPGGFDVFHNGHLGVIEDAASVFPEVIVAVGDNSANVGKYTFSLDQRVSHVEHATQALPNVRVIKFTGLLMNAAREHRADAIVQSIQEITDFPFKKQQAFFNGRKGGMPTLWIPARPDDTLITSVMLSELASMEADVSEFTTPEVAVALLEHYGHSTDHVDRAFAPRLVGNRPLDGTETVALYAGSLDPLQIGHLHIIETASATFDRVVVCCAVNPAKFNKETRRYGLFEMEERKAMIEEATRHLPNVTVTSTDLLVIEHAAEVGATAIIKGLRDGADFDSEESQQFFNREYSGLITLYVPSSPRNKFVSSSMLKFLAMKELDIRPYVPAPVVEPFLRAINPDFADRYRASLKNTELRDDPHAGTGEPNRPVFIPQRATDLSVYSVRGSRNVEGWVQAYASFIHEQIFQGSADVDRNKFVELGREIVAGYEEPHRGHHDVSHLIETWNDVIKNCKYGNISPIVPLLAEPPHDFIYNPASKTNEADSAAWAAAKYGEIGIPQEFIDHAVKVILDTAKHIYDRNDPESCAVLDSDTGALESPWDRYSYICGGNIHGVCR